VLRVDFDLQVHQTKNSNKEAARIFITRSIFIPGQQLLVDHSKNNSASF
jgi:hypothetical protein